MKLVLLLALAGLAAARLPSSAEDSGRNSWGGRVRSLDDDSDDMNPEVEDPLLSILRLALGGTALAPASDLASQSAARLAHRARVSGSNRFAAPEAGRVHRLQHPKAQKRIEPVPALVSAPGLGLSLPQTPASPAQSKGGPLSDSQLPRAAAKAPAPAETPQQILFPVPALAPWLRLESDARPDGVRASQAAPRAPSRPTQPRAQSPTSLYRSLALRNRLASRLLQRTSDISSEE
ncbi:uncharacterized protein LOC134782122 [Penaeus indicus]|uniref:uncharacterized protein LOC134782122 n=1 Tax=Penaeus indicus TaxID=29960 RepID=UPI00300C35A2